MVLRERSTACGATLRRNRHDRQYRTSRHRRRRDAGRFPHRPVPAGRRNRPGDRARVGRRRPARARCDGRSLAGPGPAGSTSPADLVRGELPRVARADEGGRRRLRRRFHRRFLGSRLARHLRTAGRVLVGVLSGHRNQGRARPARPQLRLPHPDLLRDHWRRSGSRRAAAGIRPLDRGTAPPGRVFVDRHRHHGRARRDGRDELGRPCGVPVGRQRNLPRRSRV
jgi:hypothetical protein